MAIQTGPPADFAEIRNHDQLAGPSSSPDFLLTNFEIGIRIVRHQLVDASFQVSRPGGVVHRFGTLVCFDN